MSEWKKVPLDKMGVISRGKSKHRPRNDVRLFGGEYPFIQTGDVKSAGLHIVDYSETYNEKGLAQSKLWAPGTLCITIAANIADTSILSFPACFPDSIIGFIADESKSDVRFVKYSFDILQKKCQAISLGATQDNLSWEKLSKIKFDVPELPIQRRIASILSAYDNLLENNNKRIRLLEQMAENLYKEWFVRFRFPDHENAEFENGLPKGWKIVKIKDVVKRLPFNRTYKEFELEKEGNVIVIDQSTDEYLGFHNNEPSHKANYDKPIILFGDHSCKFKIMTCDFSLGENVIPFTTNKSDLVNDYWLFYATHKLIVTEEYKRHWGCFSSMKILVPNVCLQRKFASFIQRIEREKNALYHESSLLSRQRDLLLPRLMSGKLEVNV